MNTMFMNKILLNQLTSEDLDALMENPKVVNKVRNQLLDEANYLVDSAMYPLEGIEHYSISYKGTNNHIAVGNSYLFLKSLINYGYMVYVFSQGQLNEVSRMVDRYKSDKNSVPYMVLACTADKYASILTDYFVTTYYNDIYNNKATKVYMKDMLWVMYPDGAYYLRDENAVYYLAKD